MAKHDPPQLRAENVSNGGEQDESREKEDVQAEEDDRIESH